MGSSEAEGCWLSLQNHIQGNSLHICTQTIKWMVYVAANSYSQLLAESCQSRCVNTTRWEVLNGAKCKGFTGEIFLMATVIKIKCSPQVSGQVFVFMETQTTALLSNLPHLHYLIFPSLGAAAFTLLCKQRKMLEMAAEQTK